jgi:hypothetical protein
MIRGNNNPMIQGNNPMIQGSNPMIQGNSNPMIQAAMIHKQMTEQAD